MSSRTSSVRDLALIAVFAAFVCVSTLVPGFNLSGTVPFTLQGLAVLLCGAVLGSRRGFLAVLLYLALGSIGLPVFAQGASGIGIFATGTGGYLVGFPIAAFITGLVVERARSLGAVRLALWGFVGGAIGVAVITAFGIAGMVFIVELDASAATKIALPFVPFDLVKAAIAASVAAAVHQAFPDLLRTPRRAAAPARETIDA